MTLNINDRISLRLTIECCRRLKEDSSLLNIVKENQLKLNKIHSNNINTKIWNNIINSNDLNYIIKEVLQKNHKGQLLRSSSPFSGIIPFDELKEIKKILKRDIMEFNQLKKLIKNVVESTNQKNIMLFGSQVLYAKFENIDNENIVKSYEADFTLYKYKNKQELEDFVDVVDGSIGELSQYHQTNGFYHEV